ncbi:MAG TPA: NAD(P)/FAD-dependent oxidoreductase [Corynebacterium sp.]|nr:NAD(P)/FAD-dependent oxidoreductase [Corynebacterium sp.]
MTSKNFRAESSRKHVVIVGGGFAGVYATKRLADADVNITLIDRNNYFLFQPLLYQVATGLLEPSEVAPTLRQIFRNQDNVRIVKGEVTDIDTSAKTVTSELEDMATVFEYDYLIVGAGSTQGYFGNDHFAEFAPGMKSIDVALEIRSSLMHAFEKAELTEDPAEREKLMTFVIVGAGPTGVELAGQFAELSHRSSKNQFTKLNPRDAKIILLDGAPQVLPPFGKRLGRKAQRALEEAGVDVRLNAMVTDVDAHSVTYKNKKGEEITVETDFKVWSAGVAGSPLGAMVAEQLGVELDRAGRVQVNGDLTVGEDKTVFITGDMMGNGTPGLAQGGIQSGEYAAERIIDAVEAEAEETEVKPVEDFSYFDKGSMAIVKRFYAVIKMGKVEFTGMLGWLGWLVVHVGFLKGTRAKLVSMFNWVVNATSRNRYALNATEQQRTGRAALEQLKDL